MKVKGFLKDVGGASRVTKARLKAFEKASPLLKDIDPIADVARAWHPGKIELTVTEVRQASDTVKAYRFKRSDGAELPYFYAGQYMVLDFPIGDSLISRPYTISSSPAEARGSNGYIEILVRSMNGEGFAADYIFDNVRQGDKFMALVGCGQFYYEPLRDAKSIVAIAGGVGIAGFISMAKEVAGGRIDADMTILYGSVNSDDIAMKEELDELEKSCNRIRVVHVISGEDKSGAYEKGFIDAERIKKASAAGTSDTTYFVCGPKQMYGFIDKAFDELEVPARRRRIEVPGQVNNPSELEGYPEGADTEKTYKLTVVQGIAETVIDARAGESILTALERAGIRLENSCRSGECGFCRTKVLSGNVFISPNSTGLRGADRDFGYVHACAAYLLSDAKVKVPIS